MILVAAFALVLGDGIDVAELRAHVAALTAPETAGRQTGSRGAERAAAYIQRQLAAAGWEPFEGRWRHPFQLPAQVPDERLCALRVGDVELRLGEDYVPLVGAPGSVAADPWQLVGPDLRAASLEDEVAVLDWPPEETLAPDVELDLYRRLERLRRKEAAGAVVRVPDELFEYRPHWARWTEGRDPRRSSRVPAVMVRASAWERAATAAARVTFTAETRRGHLRGNNLVGWLPGSDPDAPRLLISAHYDHLGLDPRGRFAPGADDNASGVAALLEIAEELAASGNADVLVVAFSGEEDGLIGSRALAARDLPLEAVLNLDMVGRGDALELAVIGGREHPRLRALLTEVRDRDFPGLELDLTRARSPLFDRSDHYAFHERGVPSLFFFEGLPIRSNNDYHTWRDTMDALDFEKIRRTAGFVCALAEELLERRP